MIWVVSIVSFLPFIRLLPWHPRLIYMKRIHLLSVLHFLFGLFIIKKRDSALFDNSVLNVNNINFLQCWVTFITKYKYIWIKTLSQFIQTCEKIVDKLLINFLLTNWFNYLFYYVLKICHICDINMAKLWQKIVDLILSVSKLLCGKNYYVPVVCIYIFIFGRNLFIWKNHLKLRY